MQDTGRRLHNDGDGDKPLSTRTRTTDNNSRFVFEQQTDGSDRIRVDATGNDLLVDELGDRLLSPL